MLKLSLFALCLVAPPVLADTLPESIIGGWGFSEAACATGPGAEGYLEITATEIRFFESTGRLQSTERTEEPGIIAKFTLTGEGETWTLTTYLEAIDDGETLMRVDLGEEPRAIPLALKSCD